MLTPPALGFEIRERPAIYNTDGQIFSDTGEPTPRRAATAIQYHVDDGALK